MRPFQQAAQEIRGSLHIGILAVLNTSPQRHAFVALASERIEIAVIVHQAEEWPAQDFRQRQVRLRQNRKPQQVQAILHADMVEQLQPPVPERPGAPSACAPMTGSAIPSRSFRHCRSCP